MNSIVLVILVQRRKKIILLVSILVFVSLSISLPFYFHFQSLYYPRVTIVSYQINPNVGEEWNLNVSFYSTACYRILSPKTEINEKKLTVEITIKTKELWNVVCVPEAAEINWLISLYFPSVGNWTVQCNDKTITVYVQDA